MAVVHAAEAPRFTLEGTLITGLAAPSRGSTEISAWRLALNPGVRVPEHILSREEVFVVVQGRAVATVAGEDAAIAAGDALSVPAGLPFSLAVSGDTVFEAIAAMTVGGEARMVHGDGAFFRPPWSI